MSVRDGVTMFLSRHDKLRYLLRCLKRVNNNEFVKDVNSLYNNRYMPKFKENGVSHKGKVLYLIDEKYPYYGFNAMIRESLEGILVSEELGFFPVIVMSKGCLYAEKEMFRNTDNPFEYYFKQPAGFNLKDYNEAFRACEMTRDDLAMIAGRYAVCGYRVTKEYISDMGDIWRKHIKFREDFKLEIDNEIKELFKNKKLLGVHARGTDFNAKLYGHPIPVLPEDYFREIEKIIDGYDGIFLATDDENNLQAFIKEYGDKIFYHKNVQRSSTGTNPIIENRNRKIVDRDHPNYMLGRDILLELVSLCNCSGLITGLSQVAICTRIYKMSLNESFVDDITLDKGSFTDRKKSISMSSWIKVNNFDK